MKNAKENHLFKFLLIVLLYVGYSKGTVAANAHSYCLWYHVAA